MKRLLFTVLLFCSVTVLGQTKLPSFFSDNMVLQQNSKVAIWGTDKPKAKISVEGSWGEKASIKADKEGKWKIELQTPSAGHKPYNVTIKGSDNVTLKNVLIGEVWICSGQSNMEMPVKGFRNQPVNGSYEAILKAKNSQIRLFKVGKTPSLTPAEDLEGNWKEATPESVRDFSAAGYFFGRKLHETLNIPIGLICTAWGASSAEAWVNKETIANFPSAKIADSIPKKMPQQSPTLLYNGMLHPLVGFGIKGAVWYQGESNRNRAEEYKKLFPSMIQCWREQWGQGDFPFYFVQIAPFNYYRGANAAYVREAQLYTMQTVKNTGMAVTMDIGDCNYIHPREKKTAGDRLAYWALSKTYEMEVINPSGPVYKSMEVKNNKVILQFDYAPDGLSFFGKDGALAFEVAGEDKIFYPATKIKLENRKLGLTVWSDKVPKPVAVRYAFKSCVEGTLYNTEGLPASSFRTDDWVEEKKEN